MSTASCSTATNYELALRGDGMRGQPWRVRQVGRELGEGGGRGGQGPVDGFADHGHGLPMEGVAHTRYQIEVAGTGAVGIEADGLPRRDEAIPLPVDDGEGHPH